jgi:phosphoribosylformylglycinamidine cyclo-ligase
MGAVHGMAHITGGGIAGNLSRIVPPGLQAIVDLPPAPPLFSYLAARGIPRDEMRAVFNMGIGLIAVCDPAILEGNRPELYGGTSSEPLVIGTIQATAETERRVTFRDDA